VDFSHYSDTAVQMAVDLVNTVDRASGDDQLTDVDGLLAFLDRYASEWDRDDFDPKAIAPIHVERVRRLRTRLRAVLEADTAEEAADGLNRILIDVQATPRVSLHSEHPHMHFEPKKRGVAKWLGAATAMGIATVLVDQGIERFGTCASTTCVDSFIDTSRNRSRLHCSTTCANREHVAAHRRRAVAVSEN